MRVWGERLRVLAEDLAVRTAGAAVLSSRCSAKVVEINASRGAAPRAAAGGAAFASLNSLQVIISLR